MKTTKKSLLAKLACSKVKATMIGGLAEGEIKDLRITADGIALELTVVNDARMIYSTVEV